MEKLHEIYLEKEGRNVYSYDQGGNERYSENYVEWLEDQLNLTAVVKSLATNEKT